MMALILQRLKRAWKWLKSALFNISSAFLGWIKRNWIGLLGLIAAISGAYWAFQGVELQKRINEEEKVPFFKYTYDLDKRTFNVTAGEAIDILSIEWELLLRWAGEDRFSRRTINGLSRELGRSEIIEFYMMGVSASTSQGDLWRDAIECNFFYMIDSYGLPIKARIKYDVRGAGVRESQDLLLVYRMDIDRPDIEVVSRNVTEDVEVQEFFRKYVDVIKQGLQNAQRTIDFYKDKIYSGQEKGDDGRCGMLWNQPVDGY